MVYYIKFRDGSLVKLPFSLLQEIGVPGNKSVIEHFYSQSVYKKTNPKHKLVPILIVTEKFEQFISKVSKISGIDEVVYRTNKKINIYLSGDIKSPILTVTGYE